MEQQCKIGGKCSKKNGDVLNEDRISDLPEVLLLHILSSLPTETAIATSVLSKRWKSIWKMLPNLKFDYVHHNTCSEIDVSRTLILHQAPVLNSLHLNVRKGCGTLVMELWIAFALARHVRRLVLDLYCGEEGLVKFLDARFRFNNTLEILELEGCILINLPYPVIFKSLRELYLYSVDYKDEESVSNLLCCCPCLEDLVVHRDSNDDSLHTFTIAVPSLQRLTIHGGDHGNGGGYVINTPSLKYLELLQLTCLEFILIENAPELVEANITRVTDIDNENILLSLTSAKRLSLFLSPLEFKYSSGKIFYRLLSLELCTTEMDWRNLLSLMLDSSPKLQSLKLNYEWIPGKCWQIWNQPKCVPECLLFHLETFVWKTYEWKREDEKEVATYILQNARCLKKATFFTRPIESKKLEKLEKRLEMLKELTSVVRASDSCHLVCEAETYSSKF